MKNKYLILIILIVIIGTVFVVKKIKKPLMESEITKEQVQQKFSESKQAYDIKLEQGYDLNEVLILEKQALQSYNKKNYDKAYKLLLQAKKILDRAEIPEEPIKQCSICNLPSDWSNCVDSKKNRTNYKCDTETNYECQSYTEKRTCKIEIPEAPLEITQPAQIPFLYKIWFNQKIQYHNEKIIEWESSIYKPITFSSTLGGLGQADTEEGQKFINAQIDMFANELKLDSVDIYLPYRVYVAPTSSDKKKREVYDNIIKDLKSKGIKITILAAGDLGGNPSLQWEDFKKWHLDFIKKTTENYKPEFYVVSMDPWFPWDPNQKAISNYNNVTPKDVIDLTIESAKLVKSISPSTKIIVALPPGSAKSDYIYKNPDPFETVLRGIITSNDIDIFAGWTIGYANTLEQLEPFIDIAKNNGKAIWLIGDAGPWQLNGYFEKPWVAPIDAKYINSVIYWSQNHDIKHYGWMFSTLFITYNKEDLLSSNLNQRTITYQAYKNIIEEMRK